MQPEGETTEALALREALSRALAEVSRDGLAGVLAGVAEVAPAGAQADFDEAAAEQFTHALVSVLQDAIDGGDGERRRLVLEAAVPALLAQGQGPLDLVESHVAAFSLLGVSLVEATPADLRSPVSIWLAGYFATHVREVAEVALDAAQGP